MSISNTKLFGLEGALDVSALPAFLRVLLATDGTVTKSLEAYFWEPVEVVTVEQGYCVLLKGDSHMGLPAESRVLQRSVRLQGQVSKVVYAWASSLIQTEHLPIAVREGLEQQRLGIGELLRECGLETYREVLEVGEDPKGINGPSVWRSYLIRQSARPLVKITECFPLLPYKH